MTTFTPWFFGVLAGAALFSMAKFHISGRRELALESARRKARLDEFRVKSFRPDGD